MKIVPSFRKSSYKRDNYLIKENESENKICQTHGKNGFTKVFENLATDLNIILLNYQNNYKTLKITVKIKTFSNITLTVLEFSTQLFR